MADPKDRYNFRLCLLSKLQPKDLCLYPCVQKEETEPSLSPRYVGRGVGEQGRESKGLAEVLKMAQG